MRDEFERQGVWRFMRKNIAAAEYTHPGDPLKIDCGYAPQRNGGGERRVELFHAISLLPAKRDDVVWRPESEINQAKVLAFSFPRIRAGIRRLEDSKAELTAVIEADVEGNDEAISFVLAALKEQEIRVATLAQMPAIAERARMELRL
jgi:hypothetical protein